MLESDQAAEFAYDRVVGFAVAYAALVTAVVGNPLLRAASESKREAIVIEAHAGGEHLLMVRDICWHDGRPYLAAAAKIETDEGRFAGALPGHVRHPTVAAAE
jgi:hypothetical protein